MTPAASAEAVARRGFTIIPDALDAGEVARLIEVLDRLVAEDLRHPDPRRRNDDWMAFNGALRDDVIADVVTHPRILRHVEAILGPTCIMYACVSSSMPPNGTNYSMRIHVDSPRVIPSYPTNVGVMVALTDYTEENGATRLPARLLRAPRAPDPGGVRTRRRNGLSPGRKRRVVQRSDLALGRREPDRPSRAMR